MILLGIIGFIIGMTIPAIGGRFGKILPADPGLVLLTIWHRPHFPKVHDVMRARRLHQKWMKFLRFSAGWGIAVAALFIAADVLLPAPLIPWVCFFFVLISLCIAIDAQYCLLPDFFTIPLLCIGFGMTAFLPYLSPMESFIGAIFGYLLATVSVLIMGLFKKTELGAGDVKMMTAIGAWLGAIGFNYTVFLSFFVFALYARNAKKGAPYGPALGIAAIIALFFIYI